MKAKSVGTKQTNSTMADPVTGQERHRMIAEAAYFRALQREFRNGDPLDDWFCAEREIDQLLRAEQPAGGGSPRKGARATSRRRSAATSVREAAAKS